MDFLKKKIWLAEKPGKRIYKLQKCIDQLNEVLDLIAKSEKYHRDDSAAQLEQASEFGGRFAAKHMERKEMADQSADRFAAMRLPLLVELALFESKKKEVIDALQQNGALTTLKTRRSCFFF